MLPSGTMNNWTSLVGQIMWPIALVAVHVSEKPSVASVWRSPIRAPCPPVRVYHKNFDSFKAII